MKGSMWLLLVPLALGCSGDLTRREASETLDQHLREVAPTVFDRWPVFEVNVGSVFQPDENNRRVSFRVIQQFNDSVALDTSEVREAYFQRSDQGWGLTGYGPKLAKYVASVHATHWFNRQRG